MIIKRIYNNNVVMVDDAGRERIALGRGIAFQKRRGDALDPAQIDKLFSLEDPEALTRFEKLARSIPPEYIAVAEEIVEMLHRESTLAIDDSILIALADHISLSIERERRGTPLANPMVFELKHLYRTEFALAERAAQIIDDELGVRVSEEEIGFITLHIVNATISQSSQELLNIMSMIKDILAITEEVYDGRVDPDSLSYERFLRHLQFFAERALGGTGTAAGAAQDESAPPLLLDPAAYPEAFACADRIAAHVEATYRVPVTPAEKSYLVYHLVTLAGPAPRDE